MRRASPGTIRDFTRARSAAPSADDNQTRSGGGLVAVEARRQQPAAARPFDAFAERALIGNDHRHARRPDLRSSV